MADIIVDGTSVGANRFLFLDSTGKIPAVDGSQVTTIAAGNIATGTIPIARIDVGTTANKLVQLDANAKLPALDASLLTNIPGATKNASDPAIDTNPSGGVGSEWHNTTSGEAYICTDATTDANVWTNIGAGTGDVQPYTFHGWSSNHGYTLGGSSSGNVNTIDRVSFASGGDATDVGDAVTPIRYGSCTFSSTHGYHSGGWSEVSPAGKIDVIQKYAFNSSNNSVDVANCVTVKENMHEASSTTHGYHSGVGYNSYSTQIDKHQFSNDGDSVDSTADLTIGGDWGGGCTSESYGWAVCGNTRTNVIDKFPFASSANATDSGDLTQARIGVGCPNSETYGYCAGGTTPASTRIDKWSFASGGNATTVGVLTVTRGYSSDPSSTTHGYTGGGFGTTGSGAGTQYFYYNTIDKFSFSSDGDAVDVGDLTVGRGLMHGCQG